MSTWVFKVSLKRNVWRTVELRGSHTLHDLHCIIQSAFDWDDDHLYAFFMTNKAWDARGKYGHPAADAPSADDVSLASPGLRPKQKFLYIFDFGAEIRHQITVLERRTTQVGAQYPRILQVHREAPRGWGDMSGLSAEGPPADLR